jgi:hypothetical protein
MSTKLSQLDSFHSFPSCQDLPNLTLWGAEHGLKNGRWIPATLHDEFRVRRNLDAWKYCKYRPWAPFKIGGMPSDKY